MTVRRAAKKLLRGLHLSIAVPFTTTHFVLLRVLFAVGAPALVLMFVTRLTKLIERFRASTALLTGVAIAAMSSPRVEEALLRGP